MLFTRRSALAALAAIPLVAPAGRAASGDAVPGGLALIMFEQQGCPYCAAWNRQIAPAYPKTDEGKAAPLYRRDIHKPIPAGMILVTPPQFTPTFVLLDDGREVGRIQGYAGEDFFWPMLDQLLAKARKSSARDMSSRVAAPPKA